MAASRNLGGEVPVVGDDLSSSEQQVYLTISLDENSMHSKFQTVGNYYFDLRQTYLAVKPEFVKGCSYDTYKNREVKNHHKEESKEIAGGEEFEEEEESNPVFWLLWQTGFCIQFLPMLRCKSTISKITKLNDCMRPSLTSPTTSSEPSPIIKEVCTAMRMTIKNVPMKLWMPPCLNPFFTITMKMLSRPNIFILNGTLWAVFSILTRLQFFEMLLQEIQTVPSLDRLLKIQSSIKNWISG